MSRFERIAPTAECLRLRVSEKDFLKIRKVDHHRMLFLVHLIRAFQNTLLDLKDENLVHGPVHTNIGQEANAAAAAVVLQKSDLIGSTHRAHGHFLAKALMYYAPADFDPAGNDITGDMQTAVNKTLGDIDLPLTQEVLRELLRTEERHVTIEMIQKFVADHYNVKLADLKAKNNSKSIAVPRQIAMYLTKTLTPASLPEIGKSFGGKHHSTVIHSVRKIDGLRKKDPDFDRLIHTFVQAFR